MAFFVKRPTLDSNAPLYTVGMNTSLLIVGLGNPGKEYENTRHNIGFDILDNFAKKQDFSQWILKKDLHSQQADHKIGSARIILCKPTTFMNESGRAVKEMQHFYKINNGKTLVVYDDLDIHYGQIRSRHGGGTAGHNGIKSVTAACGESFGRLRVGIGPKKPAQMETNDFVLGKFDKKQQSQMNLLLQETNAILSEFAYGSGELKDETRSFLI